MISDVFSSVRGDGGAEDEVVPVVDNVASSVEALSLEYDSNVVMFIGVTAVVNVDCVVIVDFYSVVDLKLSGLCLLACLFYTR